MKIVVFGAERRVGALVDGQIIDLNKCSSSIPSNLLAFISGGKPMLEIGRAHV